MAGGCRKSQSGDHKAGGRENKRESARESRFAFWQQSLNKCAGKREIDRPR
jgi:hypothetical protein